MQSSPWWAAASMCCLWLFFAIAGGGESRTRASGQGFGGSQSSAQGVAAQGAGPAAEIWARSDAQVQQSVRARVAAPGGGQVFGLEGPVADGGKLGPEHVLRLAPDALVVEQAVLGSIDVDEAQSVRARSDEGLLFVETWPVQNSAQFVFAYEHPGWRLLALTRADRGQDGKWHATVPRSGRVGVAGDEGELRVEYQLGEDSSGAFALVIKNGSSLDYEESRFEHGGSEANVEFCAWLQEGLGLTPYSRPYSAELVAEQGPLALAGSAVPEWLYAPLVPVRLQGLAGFSVAAVPIVGEEQVIDVASAPARIYNDFGVDAVVVDARTLIVRPVWGAWHSSETLEVLLHRGAEGWKLGSVNHWTVECTLTFTRIPIHALEIFLEESDGQLRLDVDLDTAWRSSVRFGLRVDLPTEAPAAFEIPKEWGSVEPMLRLWRELEAAREALAGPVDSGGAAGAPGGAPGPPR